MPYFIYKAKDSKGSLISGTLEAESRASAISRLQVMGYFPLSIQGGEAAEKVTLAGTIKKVRKSGQRIRARDLTTFYRQMSDLVGAGVPLVKSLGIVKSQCHNSGLQALISQIDQDVQSGDTFAKSLDRHPQVFTKLATAMVHAGETGGMLEDTLSRLADFAEAEEELRGRIKSALAYPVVMLVAGTLAIGVLITFVIPRIVRIFTDLNQTLPMMTRILIGGSSFLGNYWYAIVGAIGLAFLGIRRYVRSEQGRLRTDRALLQLPVFGAVALKREVARFTRTLGQLLRNGVPILSALEITCEVLTNAVIRSEVEKIPEGIAQGEGVAAALRKSEFFPPVVTNMIAIGEETGNLPSVLIKVASTYETQVDREVKTLTAVLEPIIILIMGLIIGFIVIAMLLPIFELDPTGGTL